MNIYLQGNRIHLEWDVDDSISEMNSAHWLTAGTRVRLEDIRGSSRSVSEEILCPLWSMEVCYGIHIHPPPPQLDPVYILAVYFKTHFNIILPSVGWRWIPGRGKGFLFTPQRSDWLWGPPSLLFDGNRGLFLKGKAAGREAEHSSLSSGEVKNGGAIPPIPYTSSWYCAYLIH
jgi:hypothetical protein